MTLQIALSQWGWIILVILGLLVLVGAVLGGIYYSGRKYFHEIFDRPFPRPAYDRSPTEINQDTIYGRGQNWFYSHRLEFMDLTMISYDRLELMAYYRPAKKAETKQLVILMHGWKDSPSIMGALAQLYLEKIDCHILIPHLRAHGMSQGNYIGYGLADSQDLLMWTDYMQKYLQKPLSIIYHGWSMGAATVLIAAGSRRVPSGVVGVVADSSYDSLDHQLRYLIEKRHRIPLSWMIHVINIFCKKYLGYEIQQISPLKGAGRIEVPVLLIHGMSDTMVLPYMSEVIYEKIRSPKRLFMAQEAEHVGVYDLVPSAYSSELDAFLRVSKFF